MEKDYLVKKGKELSYLLRHDRDGYNNGKIDNFGWRSVNELINEHDFSEEIIKEIVQTNDKKRYEFNHDKTSIRARQGHSIPVDVELIQVTPPSWLYHGTAKRFLNSIMKEGLKPQTRLYVHLSPDVETAIKVGKRHGEPVVLKVDTERMVKDGSEFYLSNNGVWLTKFIDRKYIKEI